MVLDPISVEFILGILQIFQPNPVLLQVYILRIIIRLKKLDGKVGGGPNQT